MKTLRLVISVLVCAVPGLLAQQPTLRITSPASRTIVHPGQSFSVIIQGSGAQFKQVILSTPNPIPWPDALREPPFTFTVKIPEDMQPGLHRFLATGLTVSKQQVNSNQMWLDIERPDQPVSIQLDPEGPYELRPGQGPLVIDVYGIYKDGAKVLLNASTQTTFLSEDPKVMMIQLYGVLHSVAMGSTNLVIRVNDKVMRQRVTVTKEK